MPMTFNQRSATLFWLGVLAVVVGGWAFYATSWWGWLSLATCGGALVLVAWQRDENPSTTGPRDA